MKWGLVMFLHDNKDLFEEVIFNTADFYKLPIAIIEKDYYVTLILKEIATRSPDIVFKGGTSLSKCYKIIDRFSEDIDLNIMGDTKPGESKRKKLKAHIVDAVDYCGLTLTNPESTRSRRDFNKYVIDYPTQFDTNFLKQHLIIETAVFFRAYPTEKKEADSFAYNYLLENKYMDIIELYDLAPFTLNVQTTDRTFVDKLFALGDYYLADTIQGHSRHIYDLYKLLPTIEFNDELKSLVKAVREERKEHKTCLSAQDNIDMNLLIKEIITNDAYRLDYENITASLLFKPVDYNTAIKVLDTVLQENLF